MKKILPICLLAFFSLTSNAQDAGYYGGNATFINYSEFGIPDLDFNAISIVAGQTINDNLAAEIRFGFGTNDESLTMEGVNIDFSIDKFMGVYLKYASTITGKVSPYAILGYTDAKAEGSAEGSAGRVTASASESDISFGVGVDFGLSEETSLNIEYMNFLDTSTISADGISVGFRAAL